MLKAGREFLANIGALDWMVILAGVLLVVATVVVVRHWFFQRWTQA
jgi:hypothetical protein